MPATDPHAGGVLVIDDDADVLKAGALVLKRHGFAVTTIQSPEHIWSALDAAPADVILLDLNFRQGARSGEEGLETLSRIVGADPDAVVLVITGHSGVGIAVSAMRAGASDFIMKPWNNDRLAAAVTDAVALRRRRRQRGAQAAADTPKALIVGASPAADRLRARVARLAATDAHALFVGEAGSGKSLAAQATHAASAVRDGPLVILDLTGLSPEIQARRLFAGPDGDGLVRAAAGGVLLLKSVGELTAEAFGPLLDVVEAAAPAVRILSTASGPDAVAHWPDRLRFDLAGVQIPVPPLRGRRGDILELASLFARRAGRSAGTPAKPFTPDAEAWLTGADWSGNVRQLRSVIDRAVLLAEGDAYGVPDLAPSREPADAPRSEAEDDLNLDRQERRLVEAALKRRSFNVSHAAQDLGLTRAALYRRMEKHGL